MKKVLATLLLVVVAIMGLGVVPANATEEKFPNGEEQIVNLVVPTAAEGCARTPEDLVGIEDIYAKYGTDSVLVASYTFVEDAKGFLITATLKSKYYSLNNPLAPGRSTSAVFSVPRCPAVELPPVIDTTPPGETAVPVTPKPDVVIVPETPAVPVAPEAPVTPVVPETPVTNVTPEVPAAPVGDVQKEVVLEAPAVVTETAKPTTPAPVVHTAELAEVEKVAENPTAAPTELANTGSNNTAGLIVIAILALGIGIVVFRLFKGTAR